MHFVVSGFCSKVDENCAVVGYFAASSGDLLLKFLYILLVPTAGVKIWRWNLQVVPKCQ